MTPEEQKPCPFCGSAAFLNGPNHEQSYFVACGSGCGAATDSFESASQATSAWNLRNPPALTVEQREKAWKECAEAAWNLVSRFDANNDERFCSALERLRKLGLLEVTK